MAGNPNPNDLDVHDMWMTVALGVERAVLALKKASPSNAAGPVDQSARPGPSEMIHSVVVKASQDSKVAMATKEKLKSTLTAIENIKQVGGMYEMIVGGDTRRLTEAEFKDVTSKTRDGMHTRLALLRNKVEFVLEGYERQSKIDDEAWVTSHAIKAIASVGDAASAMGRAASGKRESQDEDNSSGKDLARDALKSIESSQKQLDQGHFLIAEDLLRVAETHTKAAEKMYSEDHENVISNAQTAIDAAEFTEKASKYTLAVTAAVATVGASTAVASTAGLIAVAAPVVADVAQAGAKVAYGQKVDWLQLGVEVVVTAIVGKLAPKLAGGIAAKLVGSNPEAASLGVKAVAGIVAGVVTGRGAALIQGAANAAVLKYQNEDVTFGTLVGYTIDSVVDPKSTGFDLLLSAIGAAGVSRGTSGPLEGPPPPETPPAVPAQATAPKPPAVEPSIDMPPALAIEPSAPQPVPNEPVTAGQPEGPLIRGVHQGEGAGDGVARGNLKAVGDGGELIERKAAPPATPAEKVSQQEQQQREAEAELEQVQEQQFQKAAGDREFAAPRPAMTKTGPATEASGGPRQTAGPTAQGKAQAGGSSRVAANGGGAPNSGTAAKGTTKSNLHFEKKLEFVESERVRRNPSANDLIGDPPTISDLVDEIATVPTPGERSARGRGEKPLTDRSLIAAAGKRMEMPVYQWLKQKLGTSFTVMRNKEFPPEIRQAYKRAGVQGPDYIVVDKSMKTLSPYDSTTKPNTEHEAKLVRDHDILKQDFPQEGTYKGYSVGRPREVHTDSESGGFTLSGPGSKGGK
jgi:hypothetical protein